jgi:hypothetical protein
MHPNCIRYFNQWWLYAIRASLVEPVKEAKTKKLRREYGFSSEMGQNPNSRHGPYNEFGPPRNCVAAPY